jgi:Zn-dependent protease
MKLLKMLFGAILISLILLAHEIGHWVEMDRHGIPIEKVSLGMSLGLPLPEFKFKLSSFPGIDFALNVLPIGAYVQPTELGSKKMEKLPITDQIIIDGAGVWVNVLMGIAFGLIATSKEKRLSKNRKKKRYLILTLSFLVIYVAKNFFCTYFIGIFWLAITIAVIMMTISKMKSRRPRRSPEKKKAKKLLKLAASPISDVIFTKKVFRFTEIVCYILAAANILPIPPMDGGRVAEVLMAQYFPPMVVMIFTICGFLLMFSLFLKTICDKIVERLNPS